MATYKTPGVYIEEVSTLPPSVAEVSTAIPAFLGYTEKGPKIARITTMLEFVETFGSAQPKQFNVVTEKDIAGNDVVKSIAMPSNAGLSNYSLYYAMAWYFKNGGGACYVLSIGNYSQSLTTKHFEDGLLLLEKEDEPTLIVFPDAVNLASADYYSVCEQALAQCANLGDRFLILDVLNKDGSIQEFRNKIGTSNLSYGAAYYPFLKTALSYQYKDSDVTIGNAGEPGDSVWSKQFGEQSNGVNIQFTGPSGSSPKIKIVVGQANDSIAFSISTSMVLVINDVNGKTGADVATAWQAWAVDPANDTKGYSILQQGDGADTIPGTSNASVDMDKQVVETNSLAKIKTTKTALYNQIKSAMNDNRVVLPPSAAIAGIYARVDHKRGVWKSPANESIASVIGPINKITNDAQELLNVDPTAGKSINAIRDFTGKGTLVWGARTLAGNDNEWRYISVRRLFNMIEESSKKASAFAVFEPNDATTWLKVKAMIESFLYGLWEKGALAGPTPDAAYFVHVGLGKTMTSQDVLEGRMIIEVGIAAVRPAEFIIIKFSHKLQEA